MRPPPLPTPCPSPHRLPTHARVDQASALEWLAEGGATWLYTGLFSDMERLRPEAMLSMDFLAAAVYAADRAGG